MFSAALEIKLNEVLNSSGIDEPSNKANVDIVEMLEPGQPSTQQLRGLCQVWERIVVEVFGDQALSNVDHFGRFVVLRQKRIYEAFSDLEDSFNAIHNAK